MGTDDGQGAPPTGAAPTAPAKDTALQFDQVELASPDAAHLCGRCHRPIDDEYFEFASRVVCRPCATELGGGAGGKSAFLRALVFGGVAALVGTIVWYAIVKITDYELGLIAVGVGLLVGIAVQKGSRGRGGWKYQALAMALTYASITTSKLPFIVTAMKNAAKVERETTEKAKDSGPGATAKMKTGTAENGSGDTVVAKERGVEADTRPAGKSDVETDNSHARNTDAAKDPPSLGGFLFALVFIFGLALASPFLGGAQNIMGIIIIGIALYEAWKINRRAPVSGPFRLGAAAPVAATPATVGEAPNPASAP